MVNSKEENGTIINYMELLWFQMQKEILIGGNSRIITRKDMQCMIGLMGQDTLGNTFWILNTDMEYTDGQVELFIKDNGKKTKEKVMHIKGGQMVMSIMDSTKMIGSTERESSKRKASFIGLNMKKIALSVK